MTTLKRTTSKLKRRGLSQSLVQVGLGTITVGLLCAFGVTVQQPLPLEALPITQQESVIVPAFPPQQTAQTEDFKNDPLFLEIQKIVQAGSTTSAGIGPTNTTTDSISNSRWHAVESILAASRMLEQEVAECITHSDVEGAAKVQRAIRTLRAQAMELLR